MDMLRQIMTRSCFALLTCAISYNALAVDATKASSNTASNTTTSAPNVVSPTSNGQTNVNPNTELSSPLSKATSSNNNCACEKQIPLNLPNMSAIDLLVLANQAAVSAFTYNFVNYRKQLANAAHYFTPDGWKAFQSALDQSGNLKQVIAKKLVVSAVATGAPIIVRQGVIGNRYTWRIELPLLVSYQNANEKYQHHLMITMVLQRTQKFVGHDGVGVQQFIAHPIKEQNDSNTSTQNENPSSNANSSTNANTNSVNENSQANEIKEITPSQ